RDRSVFVGRHLGRVPRAGLGARDHHARARSPRAGRSGRSSARGPRSVPILAPHRGLPRPGAGRAGQPRRGRVPELRALRVLRSLAVALGAGGILLGAAHGLPDVPHRPARGGRGRAARFARRCARARGASSALVSAGARRHRRRDVLSHRCLRLFSNARGTTIMSSRGYYGSFGGMYLPEILVRTFEELIDAFTAAKADPTFWAEF